MSDLNQMYAQHLIEQRLRQQRIDPACKLPNPTHEAAGTATSRAQRISRFFHLSRARLVRQVPGRWASAVKTGTKEGLS